MALALMIALCLGLLVVCYVRAVAEQVEALSGFARASHSQMYRALFGPALSILALWPRFIQCVVVIAILALSDWQSALLAIAVIFAFPFAVQPIAKTHAAQILKEAHKISGTHI